MDETYVILGHFRARVIGVEMSYWMMVDTTVYPTLVAASCRRLELTESPRQPTHLEKWAIFRESDYEYVQALIGLRNNTDDVRVNWFIDHPNDRFALWGGCENAGWIAGRTCQCRACRIWWGQRATSYLDMMVVEPAQVIF